jgi:hypothetical protein
MSTDIELGRVHMTVKVGDDKVEYKPKEGAWVLHGAICSNELRCSGCGSPLAI